MLYRKMNNVKQQIFKADVTGLFYKDFGKPTYITQIVFEMTEMLWPEACRKLTLCVPKEQ